jgi:hypothetical protein
MDTDYFFNLEECEGIGDLYAEFSGFTAAAPVQHGYGQSSDGYSTSPPTILDDHTAGKRE